MGVAFTPVGRAVATAKGHYPLADGRHVTRLPGDTFVVFEGMTSAKWFKLLTDAAPAPEQAPAEAPAPEPNTLGAVAKVERERKAKAKPPMGDDIV